MSKTTQQIESYTQQDSNNIVLELLHNYIKSTVKVVLEGNPLPIIELGDKYVQLDTEVPRGSVLSISYDYINIEDMDNTYSDENILVRLRKLEDIVQQQNELLQTINTALDNRVNKHTFNLWIAAIEKNLGSKVLPLPYDSIQDFHIAN